MKPRFLRRRQSSTSVYPSPFGVRSRQSPPLESFLIDEIFWVLTAKTMAFSSGVLDTLSFVLHLDSDLLVKVEAGYVDSDGADLRDLLLFLYIQLSHLSLVLSLQLPSSEEKNLMENLNSLIP